MPLNRRRCLPRRCSLRLSTITHLTAIMWLCHQCVGPAPQLNFSPTLPSRPSIVRIYSAHSHSFAPCTITNCIRCISCLLTFLTAAPRMHGHASAMHLTMYIILEPHAILTRMTCVSKRLKGDLIKYVYISFLILSSRLTPRMRALSWAKQVKGPSIKIPSPLS